MKKATSYFLIAILATALAGYYTFDTVSQKAVADQNGNSHEIVMEAVKMPDDMYAYKMKSHAIDGTDVTEKRYGENPDPTIPGPTIVLKEGDIAKVTLENKVSCEDFPDSVTGGITGESRESPEISKIGIHVHGVHYSITDDGSPSRNNRDGTSAATCDNGKVSYEWRAAPGTHGAWPYHDHTFLTENGGEDVGLFGTVIVNPEDGKVKANIDGQTTKVDVDSLSKDYILWMTSTETLGRDLFYGMEIDYSKETGQQTPLWVNPVLIAEEGKNVRFNVLGMGDEVHSFHLHGHRWIQSQGDVAKNEGNDITDNVVDVQEIAPLQRKSFVVQAGEGVGAGDWMYHCHVFEHMKGGMKGKFRVLPAGTSDDLPKIGATFMISDEPGLWFKTMDRGDFLEGADPREGIGFPLEFLGAGDGFENSQGRSLAVISPGETVLFSMKDSQTLHTVTSLIWPTNATNLSDPVFFDRELTLRGSSYITERNEITVTDPSTVQGQPPQQTLNVDVPVTLEEPGLYVFTCKIHPYMFAAVIVDDPETEALDLGEEITVLTRVGDDFPVSIPSTGNLATSLLTTFYVVTDPNNWKDYNDVDGEWNIRHPPVPVTDGSSTVNLSALNDDVPLSLEKPAVNGIGEVWVDTQFELSLNKNFDGTTLDKPGTMTALDTSTWEVKRKVALPEINMNHPHNMWSDVTLDNIYQTQWFDSRLATVERDSGKLVKDIEVGQNPSHVMTVPDGTDQITIAMNGEEQVLTVDPLTLEKKTQFSTGTASHPHGHWVGVTSGGDRFVVTPNFFTNQASVVDLNAKQTVNVDTGFGPIATGLMPDGSKMYTADFLGNTFTVIDTSNPSNPTVMKTVDLLANGTGLPIQTPVSPDGKWMVTANVLFSKITVLDTSTDKIVKVLDCDPGCHGVNWGAKQNGGYYAYVANKFSNALLVVDPDPNKDGNASDAARVGVVALTETKATKTDDRLIGHFGMGGQGVLPLPNVYNTFIQQTVDACNSGGCSPEVNSWLDNLHQSHKDPLP